LVHEELLVLLAFGVAAGVVGGGVVGCSCGEVGGGVLVEEAVGFEHEADVVAGHHGPVFEADDVVHAEGVPDHEVLVHDVPVFLGLDVQAVLGAGGLVGVLAGGEAFGPVVGGDPRVVPGELGAFGDVGLVPGGELDAVGGDQPVGDGFVHDVLLLVVGDL